MGLTLAFVSRAASASAAIALCMAMGIRMSLISTRATVTPHCSVALSRVALGTNSTSGRAQCWQRESQVVYPAWTEGQGKPAQQKEGCSRGTSTQHGVCTVGTTASSNTCWSTPVCPVWLLSCFLNYEPHPFLRWALSKILF